MDKSFFRSPTVVEWQEASYNMVNQVSGAKIPTEKQTVCEEVMGKVWSRGDGM